MRRLLLRRRGVTGDGNLCLVLVLRVPWLRQVYFEFGYANLHVVVPDLDGAGMEGIDDPRFGGMKGDSFYPCALCLEFQFHLIIS